MKTLFALVVLFDLFVLSGTFDLGAVSGAFDPGALSGTAQAFVAKPTGNDRTAHVHALVADNQSFPQPFDFAPRNHFGL